MMAINCRVNNPALVAWGGTVILGSGASSASHRHRGVTRGWPDRGGDGHPQDLYRVDNCWPMEVG